MKRIWTIAAIVLSAVAVAALLTDSTLRRQSAATIAAWSGGMIKAAGTYGSPGSGRIIRVWIDDGGLVQYAIDHTSGATLFATSARPSSHSRWFIFVDDLNWLWVYSGDIGASVVKPDAAGAFVEVPLMPRDDLMQSAPAEFVEEMSGRRNG